MKRGFTLVEVIAALAILLIVGSLTFEVFNSSYKLINREKILVDMQDSFRNITLDIEKEIKDDSIIDYKIKDIESFNISNYKEVEPVLLINKDKGSVLYFKGKKSYNDVDIFEKIIFDNSDIKNNTTYAKEAKTLINKMDGNITLSSLVNDLTEIKFNFNNNSKNIRTYSTTINLDKDIIQEVVKIDNGEKYIEDFLQSIKHNVNVAGTLSSSESNDKHNILKGSIGYKKLDGWKQVKPDSEINENLNPIEFTKANVGTITISSENDITSLAKIIEVEGEQKKYYVYLVDGNVELITPYNLENTIIISSETIEIKGADGTGHGDTVNMFNAKDCIFYSTNMDLQQKKGLQVTGLSFGEILSLNTKNGKQLRDELKELLINACN